MPGRACLDVTPPGRCQPERPVGALFGFADFHTAIIPPLHSVSKLRLCEDLVTWTGGRWYLSPKTILRSSNPCKPLGRSALCVWCVRVLKRRSDARRRPTPEGAGRTHRGRSGAATQKPPPQADRATGACPRRAKGGVGGAEAYSEGCCADLNAFVWGFTEDAGIRQSRPYLRAPSIFPSAHCLRTPRGVIPSISAAV